MAVTFAKLIETGPELAKAAGAAVLVHGRGGSAADMQGLSEALDIPSVRFFMPEADGNTWYPSRFIEPIERNEPYLSRALTMFRTLVDALLSAGIEPRRIFLGGFSQGACLTAEFVARTPMRYGAVALFTGGVIGPPGQIWPVRAGLAGTPVFIGASAQDPHVPATRVRETAALFSAMGAKVETHIYPGSTHTVTSPELQAAQKLLRRMIAKPERLI